MCKTTVTNLEPLFGAYLGADGGDHGRLVTSHENAYGSEIFDSEPVRVLRLELVFQFF